MITGQKHRLKLNRRILNSKQRKFLRMIHTMIHTNQHIGITIDDCDDIQFIDDFIDNIILHDYYYDHERVFLNIMSNTYKEYMHELREYFIKRLIYLYKINVKHRTINRTIIS